MLEGEMIVYVLPFWSSDRSCCRNDIQEFMLFKLYKQCAQEILEEIRINILKSSLIRLD